MSISPYRDKYIQLPPLNPDEPTLIIDSRSDRSELQSFCNGLTNTVNPHQEVGKVIKIRKRTLELESSSSQNKYHSFVKKNLWENFSSFPINQDILSQAIIVSVGSVLFMTLPIYASQVELIDKDTKITFTESRKVADQEARDRHLRSVLKIIYEGVHKSSLNFLTDLVRHVVNDDPTRYYSTKANRLIEKRIKKLYLNPEYPKKVESKVVLNYFINGILGFETTTI